MLCISFEWKLHKKVKDSVVNSGNLVFISSVKSCINPVNPVSLIQGPVLLENQYPV